jgi:hypothetical protein
LANEFGFITIDARGPIDEVQNELRAHISDYLKGSAANRDKLDDSVAKADL